MIFWEILATVNTAVLILILVVLVKLFDRIDSVEWGIRDKVEETRSLTQKRLLTDIEFMA